MHVCALTLQNQNLTAMKLVKILSIGLCLTAFSVAANAQQQTTQKEQGETPVTATSDLKKPEEEKSKGGKTLTLAERNAAARRHKETKANGASPSLTDSRSQPARSQQGAKAANANRQSTGMRDNTAQPRDNQGAANRSADTRQ